LYKDYSLLLLVVVDIASIVLGFDMRRLNDVTAFRKCWYRKSVVESFMLGSHHKKSTTSSSNRSSSNQKTAIPEEKPGKLYSTFFIKKVTIFFFIFAAVDSEQQLTHAEIVCVANIADLSCTANVSTVMGNAS